jgi:phosphoribosylanthranilate isomerase
MNLTGRAGRGSPPVKVCGLTDVEEARACAEAGAWGIGLVFASASPRHVGVDRACAIVAALDPGVARVGVFVDADPAEVADVARKAGLTHVQVHGASDAEAVRAASGLPVIEGVRVDGPAAIERARASAADLVLLDAAVPGAHGGTGIAFDWGLIEATTLGRPFGVAGGLRPENVAEAVRRLRPALVDVSSGVERRPGRKDIARVIAFLQAVDAQVSSPA